MQSNGINRGIVVNTFEGGLDLDTDARLIANNKLLDATNIDITKRGEQFVVTDLKGEEILFEIEDVTTLDAQIIGATNVSFLVKPTGENRPAIIVFYIRSDFKFIIKALYTDNYTSQLILQEDLSEEDYDFLSDSSIDLDVVGKFGYDVVYFVDNRREPRKIECVTYQTNSNVMTLTLNSEVDDDGYKRINLNLVSSSLPTDAHRVYVYAYKTGGPLVMTPENPLTDTVKFLNVNYSGSNIITFKVYPEDYGDYTFQIVYHKEGSEVYRNFTIGNPYQVMLSVGSFNSFIVALRDVNDMPAINQVNSWEFLYNGKSFVGYIDTATVIPGTTKVYTTEIEDPLNYVPDGYYQGADSANTYFRVISGVIADNDINNGDVVFSVDPTAIETDVRAAAILITEGNKDRLQNVTVHVPSSITVGGINYTFVQTVANDNVGREKISGSPNFTYTIEYGRDLSPTAVYSPQNVTLDVFVMSFIKESIGYSVTTRATISNAVSEDLTVNMRVRAVDTASQNETIPVITSVVIPAGTTAATAFDLHTDNFTNETTYGPVCVIDIVYTGPETITASNFC